MKDAFRWVGRIGLVVGLLLGGVWVLLNAGSVNRDRACQLQQWPSEKWCPKPENPTVEDLGVILRERIRQSPGDSDLYARWVRLLAAQQSTSSKDVEAALVLVQPLAPADLELRRLALKVAIERRNWTDVAKSASSLANDFNDPVGGQILLGLIEQNLALAEIDRLVQPKSKWYRTALEYSLREGKGLTLLVPFLPAALEADVIDLDTGLKWVGALANKGLWLDAYSVWVAIAGEVPSSLYNGDFSRDVLDSPFDWREAVRNSSKKGAALSIADFPGRTRSMEMSFNGKAFDAALLEQYLMLTGPTYQLEFDYVLDRFKSSNGLAVVLRCVQGGTELTRIDLPAEGTTRWRSEKKDFRLSPDCGFAVSLRIETLSELDAKTGVSGTIAFDDFKLAPKAPL